MGNIWSIIFDLYFYKQLTHKKYFLSKRFNLSNKKLIQPRIHMPLKIIMRFFYIVLFFLISSCTEHKINYYKNETPKINLNEFFNGKLLAHGIVQDRSGKVINRFKVDIVASWKDDIATLDEKFVYSDGSRSSRIWKLKKIGSNQFEGTAGDVEGIADGETAGNAFYFVYDLNLPVDDSTYVINFEDWMFLMDENTLLSRSYMSKWGFDVGEVTLVMTKTL